MTKSFIVVKGFYAFIDEPLIKKGTILKAKLEDMKEKTFTINNWAVHESWINYWINMGYIKEHK